MHSVQPIQTKFGDFEIHQHWKPNELKELIDLRITHLIKAKYSKEDVKFKDIVTKSGSGDSILNEVIKRTTLRPREVILFLNEGFQIASGGNTFNLTTIREAEKKYSIKRKESITQEWQVFLPLAEVHINFYKGFESTFTIDGLDLEAIETKCLEYIEKNPVVNDAIYSAACDFVNSQEKEKAGLLKSFMQLSIALMYKWGVLGVKILENQPPQWNFNTSTPVEPNNVNLDYKIYIHPMLWHALSVKRKSNIETMF